MNAESALLLIIFLTIAGSIGIGGGVAYFSYHHEEREKATWKIFAQSNKLNFVTPRLFGEGAYIGGDFHGHQVKIDTMRKDHQTHTRITLSFANLTNSPYSSSKEIYKSKTELNGPFCTDTLHILKGQIMARANKLEIYYDQQGIENDTKYLQSILVSLHRLRHAYPVIVNSKTPVEALIANSDGQLCPLTAQSLKEIAKDTCVRLSDKAPKLWCRNCLTRFGRHRVKLSSGEDITYYGCRECGQSREFFEGKVIVVLNKGTKTKQDEQDGVLRVNWLLHKTLFDFDDVEIIQATDEEVERFAVQVGNDTDSFRKPKYSKMQCQVFSKCKLSDNSVRILNRMFDRVDYSHILNGSKKSG